MMRPGGRAAGGRGTTAPPERSARHLPRRPPPRRAGTSALVCFGVVLPLCALCHALVVVYRSAGVAAGGSGWALPVAEPFETYGGANGDAHHRYLCDDETNDRNTNGADTETTVFGNSSAVRRHWELIDSTVERNFPKARVSGGIFLYPHQSSILTGLIRRIVRYKNGRKEPRRTTVCETGFGSGHSMALFWEALADAAGDHPSRGRVVSFDKFDRPYQLPIWHHLNDTNANEDASRHKHTNGKANDAGPFLSLDFVQGNSCRTVPRHLSEMDCDVLHGSSLCPTDNIDLVEHSPCGVVLTSTAMDSLRSGVYFGYGGQWRTLRERNCIGSVACFAEDGPLDLRRDYVFAQKGEARGGEFCVAVTTGVCQKAGSRRGREPKPEQHGDEACAETVKRMESLLGLDQICPRYRIQVPP